MKMKNYFTIELVLVQTCFGYCQDNTMSKKNYFIGGSGSYTKQNNLLPIAAIFSGTLSGAIGSSFNTSEVDQLAFSVSPTIGIAVGDNWNLGVFEMSNSRKTTTTGSVATVPTININKISSFGFGVFGRYIFTPEKKFSFYVKPEFGYYFSSSKYTYSASPTQNISQDGIYSQLKLGGGAQYEISNSFRLLLDVGGITYLSGTTEDGNANKKKFNVFSSNFQLSGMTFGLEFKF